MNENNYKIFLIDDDIKTLIMLKSQIENSVNLPITVNVFAYGENSLDRVTENPDIVVLDYFLDGIQENAKTGLDILKQIKAISPDTAVIMLSGQEDMETALETIRNGAYDYIIKSENSNNRLMFTITKLLLEKQAQQAQ
ncbi:MAG: response regulator [Sphingobacteriales bacterium]|jgi:two-component system OmpR family response regulator|nr:response regulator [Sphingobacteriales bacterium]MBP9141102.1 response regulator [Chitinophagales bacterium]MDA0197706.1 response regulator [Bacteroidota bacterium]MBK6888804.1 response regulator [Sphingobacteriales bacterium]MBK7528689.1 response regulator [Sphingobacteriales bacterium]